MIEANKKVPGVILVETKIYYCQLKRGFFIPSGLYT